MNSKIKDTRLFNLPYSKPSAEEMEHQRQHAMWDRRSFFKALGLAGAGSMMLGKMQVSASPLSPLSAALSTSQNDRVLVIIRLKGGNDGLNTIIPVNQYSTYSNLRPSVKIPLANTFNLSADYAMPTFMNSLQPFWNEGKMKVIHGVGYQDQNLSHFRSADIWATGTGEDEVVSSGMMGRHYASQYPDFLTSPPEEPLAIQIGSVGNLLFTGEDNTNYAFSVADPQQLYDIAQNGWLHDMNNLPECLYGEQLGFLRGITNSTFIYAGVINEAYTAGANTATYDTTTLSKQFAMVARLIKGGLGTKVYLVTLDGFDTHAEQPDAHQALLTDLAHGLSSFYSDLTPAGRDSDVLCMTISEFGRRVEQNSSEGTDHGAAAPVMLFGAGLNGNGFVGEHPSLTDLDNAGNMVFDIDYRQPYVTVLEQWLCIEGQAVDNALLGVHHQRLQLGLECISSVSEQTRHEFIHKPLYMPDGEVVIEYVLESPRHIQIQLMNIMGQQIADISNRFMPAGTHRVAIRANVGQQLASGQYIYRIIAGNEAHSRSVILTR
jgi:uncharacterized protein (DUF1501 family)